VEGRSSYARLGLVVHMTAPTIHAGFRGHIVLEMMNFGPFPLRIDPGTTRICQLIFEELGSDPTIALKTVFQDQAGVLGGESADD
jgi:dCTP deaminase